MRHLRVDHAFYFLSIQAPGLDHADDFAANTKSGTALSKYGLKDQYAGDIAQFHVTKCLDNNNLPS